MANNGVDTAKSSSSGHHRHQVTRSITEVSQSSLSKIHIRHHPHHLYHPHIPHRRDKDKDDKSSNPAQPNLQTQDSIENTKGDIVTPEGSRNGSRRTSDCRSPPEGIEILGLVDNHQERRVVEEGDVERERQKGLLRAAELRSALMGLNTKSNSATKRLDLKYYSVLENLSVLQGMIASFKELATMTRQLHLEFKTESESITEEMDTELNGFGDFKEQQKTIESLQERVKTESEKIKTLGGRVDVLRERVEGWEKAEREGQETMSKRLKILWIVVAAVASLIISFLFLLSAHDTRQDPGMVQEIVAAKDTGRSWNESWNLTKPSLEALERLKAKSGEPEAIDDDPRLRKFDEL